jgi:hypothetical protein
MVDKKTGRVWGTGYGENRKQAIYYARNDQPREGFIKRAIGWVVRHPVKAGMLVAGYMVLRRPIKQIAYTACRFAGEIAHSLRFPEKIVKAIDNAYKVLP